MDFDESTPASVVRHWQEQTAAYENYVKLGALRALFASKDAVLVKASYLLKCAEEGVVLPRRQDLPDDAIVGDDELARIFEELEAVLKMGTLGKLEATFAGIVAISYSWEKKGHPDASRETLTKVLAPAIEWYMSERARLIQNRAAANPLVAGPEAVVQWAAAYGRERRLWRIP